MKIIISDSVMMIITVFHTSYSLLKVANVVNQPRFLLKGS